MSFERGSMQSKGKPWLKWLPEDAATGGSDAPAHNPCNRRTTTVREPAAYTGGVRPLVVRAEGSRPAADVAEISVCTRGARPPVV